MHFTNSLQSLTVETNVAAATTEPAYSFSIEDTNDAGAKLPETSQGVLTNTTAKTVVAAMPTGSKTRKIVEGAVYNQDSVAKTVTVKKVYNGTGYPVFKAALQPGETLTYDGAKWSVFTTSGELKTSTVGNPTATPGTKNGSTVSVAENGTGVLHQTVLTCTATPVSIADDPGVAQYGGAGKLYTFPEGLICTLGAVVDGSVTLGTTGTIIATWAGGIAIGTAAATTGATLTGTEADIMPEVDVAAAVAKVAVVDAVSAATALTETAARWLDGTAAAKAAYLNLVVDDDATHTAGTGTFTGTVTITWLSLGDK